MYNIICNFLTYNVSVRCTANGLVVIRSSSWFETSFIPSMCFATSDSTISALYMYTATQDLFSLTGQEMMRKLFISHRRVSGMLELSRVLLICHMPFFPDEILYYDYNEATPSICLTRWKFDIRVLKELSFFKVAVL